VGEFTIVDDAKVTEEDLGNNFFLDSDSLGKSRADTVREYLLEMNPEVAGHHVHKNAAEIIDKEINFFDKFRIVITTQLAEKAALKLATYLYSKNIPLLVCRTQGLLGYVRLSSPEVIVPESHAEDDRSDLFVHPDQIGAFPELGEYIKKFGNLEELDEKLFGEVPYVVILSHCVNKWIKKHGKVPSSPAEKEAFKAEIHETGMKFGGNDNWDEAEENAYRTYLKPELREEVQAVFENPKANLTKETASKLNESDLKFWVFINAVNLYVKNEGKGTYPASPAIPDMSADTKSYVALQKIYQARAARDRQLVAKHAKEVLTKLGSKVVLSDEEVDYYCRNVRHLAVIITQSLPAEYDPKGFPSERINEEFAEDDDLGMEDAGAEGEGGEEEEKKAKIPSPKPMHWYFALRAAERFQTKHGRHAGFGDFEKDDYLEEDLNKLTKLQSELFAELKITTTPDTNTLQEIVRAGGCEPHNIATMVGGVASQEALKLLIKQYIPLNNTWIFNGINGSANTLQL